MIELRRLAAAIATLFLTLLALPALAHLTPNSEIRLRFEPGALRADVLIPVAEYRYATGGTARPGELRRYLLRHTTPTAPDGRRWRAEMDQLRVETAPGAPDILATVTYTPPPGAPDRKFTLAWSAVIAEADSHFALVSLESDLARGIGHSEGLLGSFTAGQRTMAIDRGAAGSGALFTGALRIGANHILAGHDHLLFLLALLLPSPLLAAGGRWNGLRRRANAVAKHGRLAPR